MLIDKIAISNVKGLSKSYQLKDANLIHGDNGSGKTAILDSVRLALLGYHPKLGKTGKSIFSLSSGSKMSASVIFNDGQSSSFEASSTTSSVSKKWEGVELEDNFKLQLDPSLFFDASLQERRNSIFSVLSNDSNKEIRNKIVALINAIGNEGTIDESEVIEEFRKAVDDIFEKSEHANDAVLKIIDKAKSLVSLFRDDVRVMDKTLEGLAQISSAHSFGTASLEHYENQKNQILDKLNKLREELSRKKQIENEILNAKTEIDEIARRKSEKPKAIDPTPLYKEIEELTLAYEQQKAVIESRVMYLEKKCSESDGLLSVKVGNEISYEKALEMIPDGTFQFNLEVLKESGEVNSVVWKIENFEAKEWKEEMLQKSSQLQALTQSYNESIAPLEQQIDATKVVPIETTDLDDFLQQKIQNLSKELEKITYKRDIQSEYDAVESEALRVDDLIKKATSKKIDAEKIEKARKKSAISNLRLSLAKNIQKEIVNYSQKITEETLNTLLSAMNLFAKGIGLPNYAICDGEIGYYKGSTFVPQTTFSGSETAVLRCAATIALAMNSEYKIAIIDELGRFDADRKMKTLKCIKSLIDNGDLHQFIGVDVVSPLYDVGLNLISI